MNTPHNIFFELYESLPRQGPGNRASAQRALRACTALSAAPSVLDLGCGTGEQSLYVAEFTGGTVLAVDRHKPHIVRFRQRIAERQLEGKVRAEVRDMIDPGVDPESIDLVWSEGALYNIGIPKALRVCRTVLKAGGYLVFTDAVWRKDDPPADVKAGFDADYPEMGTTEDVLATIADEGWETVTHFTLPDEAWWDDFYTPMIRRIAELRERYHGDSNAQSVLDQLAQEPDLHRRYSSYYAYEYFVVRKPLSQNRGN